MVVRSSANIYLACEQALQGALAAEQEYRKESFQLRLEFEYLHWKSWCKLLTGGDDIINDVITLGMFFSMFVYICSRFHFPLIGGNLKTRSMAGEPQGNWRWNSNSRDIVTSFPSFFCATARVPREVAHRLLSCVNCKQAQSCHSK